MEDINNFNKIKDIKKYYKQKTFKDVIIFESKLKKIMKNLNSNLRGFKEIYEKEFEEVLNEFNNNFLLNTKFLTLIDFDCSKFLSVDQIADKRFLIQNMPTSPNQFNYVSINTDKNNIFFNLKIKKKSNFKPE